MSWNRRDILKATGAAAATLPLFRPRASAAHPKRLLAIMTFNGTVLDQWVPAGGETDFTLGPVLAPLNELRSDIIVAGGVASHVAQFDTNHLGCGPHCTFKNLSTGVATIKTASRAQDGGGQSFDQLVASRIGQGTRFPSISLGTNAFGDEASFSFRAAGQSNYASGDFFGNFSRVFGDAQKSPADLDRIRIMKQSVLDRSAAELATLVQRKLGRDATLKLQAHQDAIRDMEKSLVPSAPLSCTTPSPTMKVDMKDYSTIPTLTTATMDLVSATLACDLTRVITLSMFGSGDTFKPVFVGINDRDGHAVAHESEKDAASKQRKSDLETWKATQIAYLLERMKSVKEGDGTLLDNTVVIWMTGMSRGTHVSNPIPVVLAGGAGAWRRGRYLQFGKVDGKYDPNAKSFNDLVVSVCNAVGVPITTFGDPKWSQGPLPGLA